MSEYFDGPVEEDNGVDSQIDLLCSGDPVQIDAELLVDQIKAETSVAMAEMAKSIIKMGPENMRLLYANLRRLCSSTSWEQVQHVHESNVAAGNEEWFFTLLHMAMVGLNSTVASVMLSVIKFHEHEQEKDNDPSADGPSGADDL